jgi:glycosyltransferase involved in cell wall biosynthesis
MIRKLPKVHFVVFATAWGSAHGGINAFNRDFCGALAKCLKGTIACIVPAASIDEQNDARRQGVVLSPLGSVSTDKFDSRSLPSVLEIADFTEVEYWIGHDIITGEFATTVRNQAGKGSLAIIMHQSYEAYAEVKHSIADSDKALRQKDIFEKADKSFAIGPLLHKRLLDWSAKGQLIVPGLNIVEHRPAENALKVVVFGRLTRDNTLIKGIELAGYSVAEAIKRTRAAHSNSIVADTLIKFIGTDPQDPYAKTIKSGIEKRAGLPVNVSLIPFVSARDLIRHIKGSNLSMMLSWHEGFGLTAWESIGAGIPLIISRKSGVYELLKDHGGPACGCVKSIEVLGSSSTTEPFQEVDLEAAAAAVLDTTRDIKAAIRDAQYLRNFLKEVGYTWESAALKFIHALEQESYLRTNSSRSRSSPAARRSQNQRLRTRTRRHSSIGKQEIQKLFEHRGNIRRL